MAVQEAIAPDVAHIMHGKCPLSCVSYSCPRFSSLTVVAYAELLKMTNDIDMDSLTAVMETFVEVFSEQLTPFAVDLCTSLVNVE